MSTTEQNTHITGQPLSPAMRAALAAWDTDGPRNDIGVHASTKRALQARGYVTTDGTLRTTPAGHAALAPARGSAEDFDRLAAATAGTHRSARWAARATAARAERGSARTSTIGGAALVLAACAALVAAPIGRPAPAPATPTPADRAAASLPTLRVAADRADTDAARAIRACADANATPRACADASAAVDRSAAAVRMVSAAVDTAHGLR